MAAPFDQGNLFNPDLQAETLKAQDEEIRVEDFGRMMSNWTCETVGSLALSDESKVRVLLSIINRLRSRIRYGTPLSGRQ